MCVCVFMYVGVRDHAIAKLCNLVIKSNMCAREVYVCVGGGR